VLLTTIQDSPVPVVQRPACLRDQPPPKCIALRPLRRPAGLPATTRRRQPDSVTLVFGYRAAGAFEM
jgi:hypothetical protein